MRKTLALICALLFSSPAFATSIVPLTIPSGGSLSGAVSLIPYIQSGNLTSIAIDMPAAWTTANLTFQSSPDLGVTWNNLYDAAGNEYIVTAAASEHIILDPVAFISLPYLKIRSGTAGSPVNQGAVRAMNLNIGGVSR